MDAEQLLLEWLCSTIARDGGASLVTSLKDHYWPHSGKRLNALLIQSPIGKPKLLRFLEHHSPEIFQVDRDTTPHWVVLTDPTPSNPYILDATTAASNPKKNLTKSALDKIDKKSSADVLRQKVQYILQRRQSRLNRRALQHLPNHLEAHKVNLHWVVRQCPWELHFYLRAQDYYRQEVYQSNHHRNSSEEEEEQNQAQSTSAKTIVHPVMSEPWQKLVAEPFLEFLLQECADDLDGDRGEGKIWCKEFSGPTATLTTQDRDGTTTATPTGTASNSSVETEPMDDSSSCGGVPANGSLSTPASSSTTILLEKEKSSLPLDWLHELIAELIRLVRRDGGTQVSLGLLLHRHSSLKQILGGRDLWSFYCQHKQRFATSAGSLNAYQRPNGDVHLQWKAMADGSTATCPPIATSNDITNTNNDVDDPNVNKHRQTGKPRMKVDTVGLFSVTNSRWAGAIANVVIQCCQGKKLHWNVSEITAIDMTASVGGMTLGLAKAKTRFSKILAMEIDETRANLCRENMLDHGIGEDRVEVIHTDSVAAIPTFPKQCCIVIDPPWGGEHYKEFKDQPPLQLGPWKLEDVLERIAKFVSLSVVGLRLPVTLSVDKFLNEKLAKERGLQFELLTIRKLSVQLLVVLKLVGRIDIPPNMQE